MTTTSWYLQPPAGGHLLAHLLRFGRLLRLMGVKSNLSQMLELVRALEVIPITSRRDFYFAARALLVTRHEEYPVFDQAFGLYWRMPEPLRDELPAKTRQRARRARLPSLPAAIAGEEPEEHRPEEETTTRLSYSGAEALRNKDFAEMTWEEIEAAKAAMRALSWPIGQRPTRRVRTAAGGHHLDLRRVLRESLRYGGEPLALRWRERKTRPRPLVVLCDISGSMERYSRMLLHFVHALSHNLVSVETFVFGTRLTRITHQLRHRDVDDALDEVGRHVHDWSGGTRIGEAVKSFNYQWSRRVLGRGAAALIISDGWDRGDPGLLATEMARLQRSAHRLIWLNPLLGSESYEPIQRGMAAALPFVDDFRSVHNLNSLEQLAETLGTLGDRRPERRQQPRPIPAADSAVASR
ncbi:MAG TPA: VWA domain-containing protein [Ardenticatenaceae bacterium]|nr:VWA domain-containing protein [Ardenticatenaceae bacterium]